jgi:hypothetical protein
VIALVIDVKNRTGSAVWVSALLIADFLPGVAIGLLLGPLVDRLSRKRILVGADLTRCAVFVLLALAGQLGADRRPRPRRGDRLRLRPPGCLRRLAEPGLRGDAAACELAAAHRRPADDHGRHAVGGVLVAASGPTSRTG